MGMFRAFFTVLFLSFFLLPRIAASAEPLQIYVSPGGNDTWSGALPEANGAGTDGPMKSLHRALRALRERRMETGGSPGGEIVLGEGTHCLAEPLHIIPSDSGTADSPLLFRPRVGKTAIVSGGCRIVGWKEISPGLWQAPVPPNGDRPWIFRQLFVNGRRCTPARMPNRGDYFHHEGLLAPLGERTVARGDRSTKMGFRFRPGDLRLWPDWQQARIIYFHSWTASLHWLESLDETTGIVRFTAPSVWPIGWWGDHERYFVEGIREALDSPGEWVLDEEHHLVLYRPLADEDMRTAEVIAPLVTEWLSLEGEPQLGLWVEHVHFRNLRFQYADWVLPRQQSHDGQAAQSAPSTMVARGARHCLMEDCELAHTGSYALALREGCRAWQIRRNHFHDLGAGAVRIGEPSMSRSEALRVGDHEIDNNYIHDYGEVYRAGVGIFVLQSSDNRITHNEIHDGNYTGISVGWNWGDGDTDAHRNLVAYNHIHHVMRGMLSDGAGIYLLGTSTGTEVRRNVVHDVFAYDSPNIAWGIYLDAHSNRILVEDNLCYNTLSGGLMMHNGSFENVVRNNVFAKSANQQVWRALPQGGPSRFERNICYLTQGELFRYDANPDRTSFWDRNLYWRTDGRELMPNREVFADWQALGFDQNSIIADPLFVDPDHDDFRLRPDSPAIRLLGFQPFDPKDCGLYGDPAWVSLPARAAHPPTVLPPAPPLPVDFVLHEDFEDTPIGEAPRGAICCLGKPEGLSAIEVVEQADGGHCLLLRDAPGLDQEWNPHFYYQPDYRIGTLELAFAMKLEPGAMSWIELRDGPFPYKVGPSLKVDAQGRLLANGEELCRIPAGQWVQFRLRCCLGTAANGRYELVVDLPGEPETVFGDLNCDPDFRRVTWVGFVSLAQSRTDIFLDNLSMNTHK